MREWIGPVATYLLYAVLAACILDRALATERETARLTRETRRIQAEVARLGLQNAEKERIRAALATDPFYVERMLRERYGFRRPGEQGPASPERTVRRPAPRRDAPVEVVRRRR